MRTSELEYELPPELIAQRPASPRDSSRLMVYDRGSGAVDHRRLDELPSLLRRGDLLVYNDSRVMPARLRAVKPTGGRVELLFLDRRGEKRWEVLARPSARLKPGTPLAPAADAAAIPAFTLVEHLGEGRWLLAENDGADALRLLERFGEMPLPPYIREPLARPDEYQTVYAREVGSAAAPTAGLHFTPRLLERLRDAGIATAPLTLHIGLDTFRPVAADDLERHRIHRERYHLPRDSYAAVAAARREGRRVVAVGSTSVRVLETVFGAGGAPAGETDLFITPGYRFRAVDALLTNFHLPRSTLLAMVMAFAGVREVRRLYRLAVAERYRFYSFGDAMLLL